MEKISYRQNKLRVPIAAGDIQVNFCKNPACPNYGVSASTKKQPRGPGAKLRGRDNYKVQASGTQWPFLKCLQCNEHPPTKSNHAIQEELLRLSDYLKPRKEPSCPGPSCSNHSKSIHLGKTYYLSFGKTRSGSKRYRCKACGKTFSVGKSTLRQRKPHLNKLIFKLLMNKSPFRRICEVAEISPKTLYDKINFLYKQCQFFAGNRERKLLSGMPIQRIYVGVDRQEYVINWTKRMDKRNTVLHAVGSADNKTGYVFGMHLNFDPSLELKKVEQEALEIDDYELPHPFRKYARLWLLGDYDESIDRANKKKRRKNEGPLTEKIKGTYAEALSRDDVEVFESLSGFIQLPQKGMQVHAEYTLYGHFFFLKKLFSGIEKVRFFLDQDSGMRAACLGAFQPEIQERRCDAFYVRINSKMTVPQKQNALENSRNEFCWVQKIHPELSKNEVKLLMIKQRIASMVELGKWKDKWLEHPFPDMSEPEKSICYLTDYSDYDEDHLAWLYNKASLHAIDRFFMQVRRRLSLLERPIASAGRARRMWHGYSSYNPESIIKMLSIFRIFYNYTQAGKDLKTPAMRLGLAKGLVKLEDIIYE